MNLGDPIIDIQGFQTLAIRQQNELLRVYGLAGQAVVQRWNECQRQWVTVGDPRPNSFYTSGLAADASGHLVVARTTRTQIITEQWDGGARVPLGTPRDPIAPGNQLTSPVAVLDPQGLPVVAAYQLGPNNSYIQAWRWDGTGAWQELGSPTGVFGKIAFGLAVPVTMAMKPNGSPLLSWRTTNSSPIVVEGSGATWTQVGPPLPDTMIAGSLNAPVVRVDANGQIFACWTSRPNASGPEKLYAARWSGSEWVMLANPFAINGNVHFAHGMTMDANGLPIVASAETLHGDSPNGIYLYRWTGTAWIAAAPPMEVPLGGNPSAHHLDVVADAAGRISVAWPEAPVARFVP